MNIHECILRKNAATSLLARCRVFGLTSICDVAKTDAGSVVYSGDAASIGADWMRFVWLVDPPAPPRVVQGTDPEVVLVLVLEAHRREGQSAWKYALTRRSMLALEADLDGERVWTVPHSPGTPDEAWFQGGIAKRE